MTTQARNQHDTKAQVERRRAARSAIVHALAQTVLGIDTLEARNLDSLDFHAIHVDNIADALTRAFDAGRQYAQEEARM